jgi:hypothetical protein
MRLEPLTIGRPRSTVLAPGLVGSPGPETRSSTVLGHQDRIPGAQGEVPPMAHQAPLGAC